MHWPWKVLMWVLTGETGQEGVLSAWGMCLHPETARGFTLQWALLGYQDPQDHPQKRPVCFCLEAGEGIKELMS